MTDFEVGGKYMLTATVKACIYDEATQDCVATDMADLTAGTELTYTGEDNDKDGGSIFKDESGTLYCFHNNDLENLQ